MKKWRDADNLYLPSWTGTSDCYLHIARKLYYYGQKKITRLQSVMTRLQDLSQALLRSRACVVLE